MWGDAKPGNLVVDLEDDMWLIDFGGEYNEGWVDEELEGTMEGDNQALKKILGILKGAS